MIRNRLNLSAITPFNRMQIEQIVRTAGKFSSHILFEHKNRTINGKSMLGLLSMGISGMEDVTLVVEGEDEEKAAQEMKRLLKGGVAAPKQAADAETLVQKIKRRYADLLADNLLGIYLHGSLASGCFQWERSNIDFLVVVKHPLSLQDKIALVETLYALSGEAPPEGFEMSVLLEADCLKPAYPMSFDLHYSSMWKRDYERDPQGYCIRMHGEDSDLTMHIMSLHAYGETLLGPEINRVFGPIPREDALCAMREDIADAGDKLHEKPVYFVLNLCRSLAYKRENLVLSKKAGGEWALKKLPNAHQAVIQAALNAYQSGHDMFYDRGQAEDFCYDAMEELSS